jgi:hypothetical protein
MNKLLFSALIILLNIDLTSCSQNRGGEVQNGIQQAPQVQEPLPYLLFKAAHSHNVVLTTAQYTGVLLNDPVLLPVPYGLTTRTLSPTEVVQAERILARCTQQGRVRWYLYKLSKDSTQQSYPDAIDPLPFYARQYKGPYTEDGQRVVWVNAFPKNNLSSFLD